MAKRFGRNQRRQLREQLAEAKATAATRAESLFKVQERYRALENELREWATRITELLGEGSAFSRRFDTRRIDRLMLDEMIQYRRPYQVLDPGRAGNRVEGYVPAERAMRVIDCFTVFAESRDDFLRPARIFYIEDQDGRCAFSCDHETLYRLKKYGDPELKRYITERLVLPYMAGGRTSSGDNPVINRGHEYEMREMRDGHGR